MSSMWIDGRKIGRGEPALVVAEIGVNHDGSVDRALELVTHARDAGADAIKLQLFRARSLMHPSSCFAEYQKQQCDDATPIDMLRRYELDEPAARRIVAHARSLGLIPLATPFSLGDVELLESLELPAVKIASPDLVNLPLLRRAARGGKPLLVSTGAATAQEVGLGCAWLREQHVPFALLHCVSAYPTPDDDANLCWIEELAVVSGAPVGYSDHTTDLGAGAFAVAAGACIVEKHLTYDRSAAGPDHSASADPGQFAEYVRLIRRAQRLMGRSGKRVLECEGDVRRVSRQSLVVRRDLGPGERIEEADLTVQRPGTGVPAGEAPRVVGRSARRAIRAGTMLTWDLLSDAA